VLIRRCTRLAAVLLVALSSVLLGGSASAYHTYGSPNDYHLTQGVHGREYWLAPSVGAFLESEIYSAKWTWGNAMPGKVAWNEVVDSSDSEIDVTSTSQVAAGCAITLMYQSNGTNVNNGAGGAPTSNWAFATIAVLPLWYDDSECINQRGILVHEFGHAMGLAHEWPNVAVMRTYIAQPDVCCGGQIWTAPKQDDKNGINHIFY
jgi:hypothetical protein